MARVMNPNSLKNLGTKKDRKDGYGHMYAIPQEKIDKLYKLLADGDTLYKAAKKVDICFTTAKKYFLHGDPRRGIKPIKVRIEMLQDTISREFDKEIIERRRHLVDVIVRAIDQIEEKIEANVLSDKATYANLVSLARLEVFLRGGGVETRERKTIEATSAEDIRSAAEG